MTIKLHDYDVAQGMAELSRETGLGRESLYKALSAQGNPQLSTVLKVAKALGLQLHVKQAA
jgi:probable addiction module antidote protein